MTTLKWHYTDAELRTLYRDAANRGAQIKIIAELEAKTVPEVVAKLESLGECTKDDTVGAWGAWKNKRLKKLLESGRTMEQIAEVMGVSEGTILRHKALLGATERKERAEGCT